MSKIEIENDHLLQSGYTYLQAVGSDASDYTVMGRQLRWDFLRGLGENHLAKGDYMLDRPTEEWSPFDHEHDFVSIKRTSFEEKNYFVIIDFTGLSVDPEVENVGPTRNFTFTFPVEGTSGLTTEVEIRFLDTVQFDLLVATVGRSFYDIMHSYTGIVEVEAVDKLSFYFEFEATISDYLRAETICIADTIEPVQKHLGSRKKYTSSDQIPIKVIEENIKYLRFDKVDASIERIYLITYFDFIKGTNDAETEGAWTDIGDFALSTDDEVMIDRLLPESIDYMWPKFNESDQTTATGVFTVKSQNYIDRWRKPGFSFDPNDDKSNDNEGLQQFINYYLKTAGVDNRRAVVSIPNDDPTDSSTQEVCYLDMMRLVSLDYHIARILGLGHIDQTEAEDTIPYIYCLEYKTFKELEEPFEADAEINHVYMTLPTSISNYRLPKAPTLTPPTFGVSVDNGTPTPTLLTDPDGYAPFGETRFININRAPFLFERPFGPFYYNSNEFSLGSETPPVAYGLEYKEHNEDQYRRPEICHDPIYSDPADIPETRPILETGSPTIYTHQEREEGTHLYSSYSINWFSRVSGLSNEVGVSTAFPEKYHLLPPFNLAIQLIQDEDPTVNDPEEKVLVLTTIAEQEILEDMSGDNTLVRTSFDWNYVHHNAHQSADYAELFFRKEEPAVVKGRINTVTLLPGNLALITTVSYDQTSVDSSLPHFQIIPNLSNALKFVGSLFSSNGNNYVIESATASTTNPTFTVKQIKENQAVSAQPSNTGGYISAETFIAPKAGDLFFALENMSALENWDLRHKRRVYLEKFFTNSKIGVRYSATRIVYHDIKAVELDGSDTRIDVEKAISVNGTIQHIEYAVKHILTEVTTGAFKISGDHTSDFVVGKQFWVFGSKQNDALYTVGSSSHASGVTTINVVSIPDTTTQTGQYGLLEIVVERPIPSGGVLSNANKSITITGNRKAEIDLANIEYRTNNDGTLTRQVIGGIVDDVVLEPIVSIQTIEQKVGPPLEIAHGTGYLEVIFQNKNLIQHIDKEISWNKGIIRLPDNNSQIQPYQVVYIENVDGIPSSPLTLIIQDPGFVLDSIGGSYTLPLNTQIEANYHPSYKLYLESNVGSNPLTGNDIPAPGIHFANNDILPGTSESSRKTYMAVRSYDIKNEAKSFMSAPVVLLGQKITVPVQPNPPEGPFYATRPDFYGKSTYTFDTVFSSIIPPSTPRVPYSILFFRSSEDRILDVLYRKSTQEWIWDQLNNQPDPMFKYDPRLWKKLFECDNVEDYDLASPPSPLPTPNAGFSAFETTGGQFTWPLPDNDGCFGATTITPENSMEPARGGYIYPFEGNNRPSAVYRPFQCDIGGAPLFDLRETEYMVYGKKMSGKEILKKAILSAFLPLTEQAPIFSYIKTGTQTSSEKVSPRDTNGNIIDPTLKDIYPMIKRFPGSSEIKLRFTDYTLDGASKSLYFYLAMEMSSQLKYSEPSIPVGPVMMVNTFPAEQPQIRKVISMLQNAVTATPTSVLFELNAYSENEKISKIGIYRAYNEVDALSLKNMTFVKEVDIANEIVDDFSDLNFPAYGEKLYYRLTAIREMKDVNDATSETPGEVTIKAPSKPSEVVITTVVDTINPEAPEINITPAVSDPPVTLTNVILTWPSTCYNGKYYLYKMTNSGNWQKIYEIKSNAVTISVELINTDLQTTNLEKTDSDGNTIYHRFRVQVENSSGLLNIRQNEKTI